MTIWYVNSITGSNSNSGNSANTPLASLQAAANDTKPGDTVEVAGGVYSAPAGGGGVLSVTTSGTAAAPITYEAMAGQDPVIDSSGNWAGIAVNASYIVIKGFDIRGDAQSVTSAQAAAENLQDPVTDGDGIDVGTNSGGSIPNHVLLENNNVHDEPGGGIVAYGSDYISIVGNTITGNAHWSPYGSSGISFGFARNTDNAAGYHNVISGNVVSGNQELVDTNPQGIVTDGNGIIIDSTNTTGYTGRTLVANNTAYDNGSFGISAFKSNSIDFTSNTTYSNNETGDQYWGNFGTNEASDIQTNVTIVPGTGGAGIEETTGGPQTESGANLFGIGGTIAPVASVTPVAAATTTTSAATTTAANSAATTTTTPVAATTTATTSAAITTTTPVAATTTMTPATTSTAYTLSDAILTTAPTTGGFPTVHVLSSGSLDQIGISQTVSNGVDDISADNPVWGEWAQIVGDNVDLSFVNATNLTVAGNAGNATITAASGNNTFLAGSGSMDITGGPGMNDYVFNGGAGSINIGGYVLAGNSGSLKIEDFKSGTDTLTVSKNLEGAYQTASDGNGGTLLSFGTGSSIDLVGQIAPATAQIHWV